jgi:lysophospholipid acyltransferase (LPLAT)-like uncharacterized protein
MCSYSSRFLKRLGIQEEHTASWFSHDNTEANISREKLAQDSLEMLIQWLKEGGNVGIHGEDPRGFPFDLGDVLRTDD